VENDGTSVPMAGKQRITIHIDSLTYRVLQAYAAHENERTANHAAFRLVVEGVRRLRADQTWAADIFNEERIRRIESED
jgi:hypothetical protein